MLSSTAPLLFISTDCVPIFLPSMDEHPAIPDTATGVPFVVHDAVQSNLPDAGPAVHVVDEFSATHFVAPYVGPIAAAPHSPAHRHVVINFLYIFPFPCFWLNKNHQILVVGKLEKSYTE